MSQSNNVDTSEQVIQNIDTNQQSVSPTIEDSHSNEGTQPSGGDQETTPPLLTQAQLDSMSDDEFTEFMESGKIPKIKAEDKKPEPEAEAEVEDKKLEVSTDKPKENKEVEPNTSSVSKDIDYETTYKEIFKPFKANGKEIVPRTVDDVIQLMQMGANYTKKMQLMAPMKKTAESLNKADITSEKDLNFLIDLFKGDKEAIKQLLNKHKVDPLELDLETTNYVPKNNIVSDEDVEYSNTLHDIQDSIPKIQEIITKTWDSKSKETVLKDPSLLKALHEEIAMDRFDKVQAQLEIEKTFGRYKDKSDIEAYIDLVTKLVAKEQNQATKSVQKDTYPDTTPRITPTKPIPDKSKAAPIKGKTANQGTSLTARDIFSMSDEQFSKLNINDLV